jgi:hypothetical protein
MLTLHEKELVFSFPDVDERAVLRLYCSTLPKPEEAVGIQPIQGGFLLETREKVVLHFRPQLIGSHRYPFAVVVAVDGINALTGEAYTTLSRSPQNYLVSPPQGALDGYWRDAQVLPLQAGGDSPFDRVPLVIKVFPMKREAILDLEAQLKLIPGVRDQISLVTLQHGGERQIEPLYEDLCNLGSWDQSQEQKITIWLARQGNGNTK